MINAYILDWSIKKLLDKLIVKLRNLFLQIMKIEKID